MAQPTDTSAIHRLIRRARFRIRGQWALEGATTAAILAAAAALGAIFLTRMELVSDTTGIYLLIGAGLIVVAGAAFAASRKLDDEMVARRIDRASNLSDRLSTAIAFSRIGHAEHETTRELMDAAIRDGVRAAPRADLVAATPFTTPRDLAPAGIFIAVSALAAGLFLPTSHPTAHITRAVPDHAVPGAEVTLEGTHLLAGATMTAGSLIPADGTVFLGPLDNARPIQAVEWTDTQIRVRIPADAPLGESRLTTFITGKNVGGVAFGVVSKTDERYHKDDAVALDPDEREYVKAILAELRNVGQRDKVPELEDFAKQIEKLLGQAENGEISKEKLLDELAKAEEALNKDSEPNQAELDKKMAEMGKELAKQPITKELGEALEKNDLDKAKQELEKLADKLANQELSEQQKQDLAQKLDQVAKQMAKQDQKDEQKQDAQQKKLEDEIRRLEDQKKQAKNDQQRQDLERRLEDKNRELQKLKKDEEDKQQSDQRRALKRLEKDMEKAAENLEKKPNQDKQDQQDQEQQASQKLKDAARETGRVDQDKRKQATQKKMSSQMDDLREAMRRAKQKGNKGPQDPFNKNGKNQDYISRARGQKSGQGQSWKPGQQGQGQGQQQGGQGQGQGSGAGSGAQQSDTWGVGHDDNLAGDPTTKSGNDKDAELSGKPGENGGSTRETILAAAQKGFASTRYQKVFADYQRIVEEVMRTEKLPSSYKYYVKRYFAKIHPSMGDTAPKDQP